MGRPRSEDPHSSGEEFDGWWAGAGRTDDPGYGYTGGPWPEHRPPGPVSPVAGGSANPDAEWPGQGVAGRGGDLLDPYPTRPQPAVGRPSWDRPGRRAPAGRDAGEPSSGPRWAAVTAWTIGWFVVPVLLYLGWAATRGGSPPESCLDPGSGPCPSPREEAVAALVGAIPSLLAALILALLIAAGLRRLAVTWRAGTVALSSAVIGAGLATMIATTLG